MWTPQNRKRYDRSRLRYPSDLTDEEWAHVAPLIPPVKPGGNKRTVDVREVMNGVMYVLSTDCEWRALPKDLPPKSTVHDYFILYCGVAMETPLWLPHKAYSKRGFEYVAAFRSQLCRIQGTGMGHVQIGLRCKNLAGIVYGCGGRNLNEYPAC